MQLSLGDLAALVVIGAVMAFNHVPLPFALLVIAFVLLCAQFEHKRGR